MAKKNVLITLMWYYYVKPEQTHGYNKKIIHDNRENIYKEVHLCQSLGLLLDRQLMTSIITSRKIWYVETCFTSE